MSKITIDIGDLAQISERAYRRGFQQGHHAAQRGDEVVGVASEGGEHALDGLDQRVVARLAQGQAARLAPRERQLAALERRGHVEVEHVLLRQERLVDLLDLLLVVVWACF